MQTLNLEKLKKFYFTFVFCHIFHKKQPMILHIQAEYNSSQCSFQVFARASYNKSGLEGIFLFNDLKDPQILPTYAFFILGVRV